MFSKRDDSGYFLLTAEAGNSPKAKPIKSQKEGYTLLQGESLAQKKAQQDKPSKAPYEPQIIELFFSYRTKKTTFVGKHDKVHDESEGCYFSRVEL